MKKKIATLLLIAVLLMACSPATAGPLPDINPTQTQSSADYALANPETLPYDTTLAWMDVPSYAVDSWENMIANGYSPANLCGTADVAFVNDTASPRIGMKINGELFNGYTKATGINFGHQAEEGRPVTYDQMSGTNMLKVGLVGQPALYLHRTDAGSYQVACAN